MVKLNETSVTDILQPPVVVVVVQIWYNWPVRASVCQLVQFCFDSSGLRFRKGKGVFERSIFPGGRTNCAGKLCEISRREFSRSVANRVKNRFATDIPASQLSDVLKSWKSAGNSARKADPHLVCGFWGLLEE